MSKNSCLYKVKRCISSLLVLAMVMLCMASFSTVDVEAATIKLNASSKVLYHSDDQPAEYTLTLKGVNVKNSSDIKWTTSKKNMVSLVTGSFVSPNQIIVRTVGTLGKVNVYATYKGKKYTCKFQIKNEVVPSGEKVTLNVGDSYTIPLKTQRTPTYQSYDESIATVSSKGVVKAKKAGLTQISVTLGYNHYFFDLCVNETSTLEPGTVRFEYSDGTTEDVSIGNMATEAKGKSIAYVYYGVYPQSCVYGSGVTEAIAGASYDEHGYATVNGITYLKKQDNQYGDFRIWNGWNFDKHTGEYGWSGEIMESVNLWKESDTYYFRCDPIKWKVLSNDNGRLTLISDKIIDYARFHETGGEVAERYYEKFKGTYNYYGGYYASWSDSTIRSWLNGYGSSENGMAEDYSTDNYSFINVAFTKAEQELLCEETITSLKGEEEKQQTETTTGKVWIPSIADVLNTEYGFSSYGGNEDEYIYHYAFEATTEQYEDLQSRTAFRTDYVAACGGAAAGYSIDLNNEYTYGTPYNACYMTRDTFEIPDDDSNSSTQMYYFVTNIGYFERCLYGLGCGKGYANGIRPMIKLDVSSMLNQK